jgi:hypothetical protein
MATKKGLTIKQIAEAFSRHAFESTYPYLSDTIQWHLIGDKVLKGKQDIMATCAQSTEYLASVTTQFSKFKVVVEENCVVIDSEAAYIDEKQEKTVVASCDIYEFMGGQISNINSYCIEIKND